MTIFDWPISYSSCRDCSALDELDEDQKAAFEAIAVDLLNAWTNRQYGVYTTRTRPEGSQCRPPSTFQGGGPPTLTGSAAFQPTTSSSAIRLRDAIEIVAVRVDGEILEPSAYVLERGVLYRIDGNGWPRRQNMDRPVSEEGTFEIEYLKGILVPEGGQMAAGLLACEFAKAACGDQDCQLPERVQTVTRQGVTIGIMDQFEDLEKGHTGIWSVDSWVASVTAPRRPSTVMSPDTRRNFRR